MFCCYSNTITFSEEDPSYAAFHDEEWGVPVHDDKYVMKYTLSFLFLKWISTSYCHFLHL